MLTPRSYPFILLLFQFCSGCPVSYLVSEQTSICLKHSAVNPELEKSPKKKTITAVSFTTRKLSLSFPYLVPKSCPIVVLTIRRPDIQANQRLQSKNPQSSLQIPCDHKDKEKRNKSAAIVPHYHQQATTFRFGWILSRLLLRMPTPPPLWTATSTGPHHHLCSTPPRFQFCPVSHHCILISLRRSDLKR